MDAVNFVRFAFVIPALGLILRITPLCLKNCINLVKWNCTLQGVPSSRVAGRALAWRSQQGLSKLIKAKSGWIARATMKRNYPVALSLSKSRSQNKRKLPKRTSEVFLLKYSLIFCAYHLAIPVKISREPHS